MFKFFKKKQEEQPVIPAERVLEVLRTTERKKSVEQTSSKERD